MKKILILGGSSFQIPIIKYAKSVGTYVITCDYLPNNPGHKFSDEYHNISTVDMDAVLDLAKKLNIDAIVDYSSDPNVSTAAYVAEKMGLKGNPFKTVETLSNKNLFRELLKNLNFPVPKNITSNNKDNLQNKLTHLKYPLILKPIDSCGSKGVFKINNFNDVKDHFNEAKSFSKKGEVIIEEYITGDYKQVHGDAYVHNGNVILFCIGDHHFNNSINNLVPYSTTLPSTLPKVYMNELEDMVQKIITEIGFIEGGINIEARIQNEQIYIIEIGARNGGNHIPKLVQYATSFNFVKAKINFVLGLTQKFKNEYHIKGFYSHLVVHSVYSGILKSMTFSKALDALILEKYIYLKPGDEVRLFKGSNAAIGLLLVKYDSLNQMHNIIKNYNSHVFIELINE